MSVSSYFWPSPARWWRALLRERMSKPPRRLRWLYRRIMKHPAGDEKGLIALENRFYSQLTSEEKESTK